MPLPGRLAESGNTPTDRTAITEIRSEIGVSNRVAATRWAVTHRVVDSVLDG